MNVLATQLIDFFTRAAGVARQSPFLEGVLIALFSILGVFALAAIGCDPQALATNVLALW